MRDFSNCGVYGPPSRLQVLNTVCCLDCGS